MLIYRTLCPIHRQSCVIWVDQSFIFIFTLRAKLSGAVYCYRPICGGRRVFVGLWVCYHDNSKLHASIFTKLGQ